MQGPVGQLTRKDTTVSNSTTYTVKVTSAQVKRVWMLENSGNEASLSALAKVQPFQWKDGKVELTGPELAAFLAELAYVTELDRENASDRDERLYAATTARCYKAALRAAAAAGYEVSP